MMLSQSEKERYNRHIIMHGFGEEGQAKLKNAKVLVVGAGGLGCPVMQYLVAAGVGTIGIVDGDVVSLSNLQRQVLYTESEVGQSKAGLSGAKMKQLNSAVDIHVYNRYLTSDFADELFPGYDVVVGCTDNYESRHIIDANSKRHNIPFVHGSICGFEGQLCVFNYNNSYSYADIFGSEPANLSSPVGVVGAIPGIIGSMMAMETIKIVTGIGQVLANRLLLYDALKNSFSQLPF
ncbi:MAG TPA: HesA/MoeB/ThiF family protein [Paludibacter sp.]|nr:HesA/MoeB/ThiF family protein [Paludibacter sp.]